MNGQVSERHKDLTRFEKGFGTFKRTRRHLLMAMNKNTGVPFELKQVSKSIGRGLKKIAQVLLCF